MCQVDDQKNSFQVMLDDQKIDFTFYFCKW
jgi:hypothetical protein